ncbi:disease resistance protein SUMM2-like [Silene latifolia]|uniref:disease resistance protein SUMM2-like n=1 Tax=Silene latifolia TaxID=37657 RepID=UPI003D788039
MARELQTTVLASVAAGTVNLSTVSDTIKHVKRILDFIGEFPEWYHHNTNLEEHKEFLRRKMVCLEGVKDDVETQLQNTELQSGKKRKREVDHWLKNVKKKADDVSKVETAVNSVHFLPRFFFRAWLGSCIGEEIQQVTELIEHGKFPEGLLLDAPRDGGEPFVTNRLVGQAMVTKIDEICASISNPEVMMIGVQGPEGIGKTALMMEVYNRLCSRLSHRVYYVNVPQDFTTHSLQTVIATAMKVDIPECGENVRAARIFNVLNSIKDYIVILDGLSEFFRWEEVGIPAEGNAGKLVFTSRSLDVCRRMVCQETVVLERLSLEDSEILFMEKLTSNAEVSAEVREVARNVVQKCNGVPSRIIDMGIQLRGVTDLNEWRSTLNEM